MKSTTRKNPPVVGSHADAGGGNRQAKATNNSAKAVLTVNSFYTGTVVGSSTSGLYDVNIDGFGTIMGCLWAGGIVSGLAGIKLTYTPPPGTRVVVLYQSPCIIVQTLPNEVADAVSGGNRTLTGLLEPSVADFDAYNGAKDGGIGRAQTPGCDMVEGELELGNLMGSALQLLTSLSKLSGGGRAEVECHVLNDMVRIISNTFKHFNAFGDFQIYNDGRLNFRMDGTSYDHEAWGAMSEDEKKANMRQSLPDLDSIDAINATGRWRFSHYLGFLGDFLHTFFTDPVDSLGAIAEDALRSGKADVHINMDGSVMVRSVSEIVFERVSRIPVPIEKARYDLHVKEHREKLKSLDKQFLRSWNYGEDMRNTWMTAYQLRDYARYLNQFHSIARFLQQDDLYRVPTEAETPEPSFFNKEKDREEANSGKPTHYDVYATMRIMRDGSIVHWDGSGSSIELNNGDARVSAARHLNLEAAGDVNIIAGQNIHLKARRSIEITAVVGGLICKARTWFHALCEQGSLWLKSDAVDPGVEDPPVPEDEEQDPKPIVFPQAVLIESSKGRMVVQSERALDISTNGEPDSEDPEDVTASVTITSRRQDVRLRAARNTAVLSSIVGNGGAFVIKCATFLVDSIRARFNLREYLSVGRGFVYWNRREEEGSTPEISEELHIRTLRSNNVNARFSIKSVDRGPQVPPDSGANVGPHFNHIQRFEEGDLQEPQLYDKLVFPEAAEELAVTMRVEPSVITNATMMRSMDNQVYGTNEENRTDQHLVQSLAQQFIVGHPTIAADYGDWDWSADSWKPATRVAGDSFPYPGIASPRQYEHATPTMPNLDEQASTLPTNSSDTLQARPVVFKFLKLPV